jgi:ubiquinone/menaquinone biosynthesis C-methylase UbiE
VSPEGGVSADAEFDERYFGQLRGASDHWWVRGMQDVGRSLLGPLSGDLDVLDLGCGTGTAFSWLDEVRGSGGLHACDIASAAVRVARDTGLATSVVQASMDGLPYRDQSFDLVVNADVLQHLVVDAAASALIETRRVLRPGGRLLLRTNGDSFRKAVEQRESWRLYNPSLLRADLEAAGFEVERISFANSLPSIVGALSGLAKRRREPHHHDHDHEHADHEHAREESHAAIAIPTAAGGWRSAIGRMWLRSEARWLGGTRRHLPFGHAVVALARRPRS